jgi:hypothetical protein
VLLKVKASTPKPEALTAFLPPAAGLAEPLSRSAVNQEERDEGVPGLEADCVDDGIPDIPRASSEVLVTASRAGTVAWVGGRAQQGGRGCRVLIIAASAIPCIGPRRCPQRN